MSGSAMAAPMTDVGKQIVSDKPGSILSLERQDVTDLFPHADQRLLVNYRSRGIQGEPIVASAFILLPKGTPPKMAGRYWLGRMVRLELLILVHLRVIMLVGQFTHIKKLLPKL